jgi:hypothetical protein
MYKPSEKFQVSVKKEDIFSKVVSSLTRLVHRLFDNPG